jgi:2-aminobenzoate-CoA ligase
MPLLPSAHVDTFPRDNLPPESEWPVLSFNLPRLHWSDRFNCAEWLLERALQEIDPQKPAVLFRDERWSYADLASYTNRICNALVGDWGVVPGNRVLLRGINSPTLFAAWLAVVKVGAIPVCTMPLLRSRELREIVEKAQVRLAICQADLADELGPLCGSSALERMVAYGGVNAELERITQGHSSHFSAVPTSQDDVCLLAFTSGTTGKPKATAHFHRDVAAMCETFAAHMLSGHEAAVFTGTPPIAFTFGLGALLAFPLYFRAAIAIPEGSTPTALAEAIQRFRATHVSTSPTAYKALAGRFEELDLKSMEVCVAAGEALSEGISNLWYQKSGIRIVDGIGGTEMIHIFMSATGQFIRPGSTGKAVPGYVVQLFDEQMRPIEGPGTGRLGVRGPTGCRYLADSRQRDFVKNGWNMTGDLYRRDAEGYHWYVARIDDMIVSGGYNIAGPEIETALCEHPAVQECAVVGWDDTERGQIVKAFVVVKPGVAIGPDLIKTLQDYVKSTLAPYKYPRAVEFVDSLPKTATGKLQRSQLRSKPASP